MPTRGKTVTNAVLLEKLSNHIEVFNKFETSVTQNFGSLANVLKEGYVTKDQLQPYLDRIVILEADVAKRVHKDTWRPYAYVLNTIGAAALSGGIFIIGKMIYDYIRGGPPL